MSLMSRPKLDAWCTRLVHALSSMTFERVTIQTREPPKRGVFEQLKMME
jgi:hypothetical protein